MGIWSICGSYTRAVEAKSVKRPGSRTHQDKRDKTGDVEEIAFVSGRSELSPAAGDTHQLDGAEAVGQMHGEDSDRQQDDGGNAYECDEGSDEDRDAAANFGGNGKPGHELRRGDADGVEDGGERGRSLVPFRETMGQKSVADDQSKWDGGVRREFRFHLTTHSFQMIHKDGTLCGDGSYRGFSFFVEIDCGASGAVETFRASPKRKTTGRKGKAVNLRTALDKRQRWF